MFYIFLFSEASFTEKTYKKIFSYVTNYIVKNFLSTDPCLKTNNQSRVGRPSFSENKGSKQASFKTV